MKLIIRQKGIESGPYSPEQVSLLIREGKLLPSDCVRVEKKKWFWVPQDEYWIPVALLPGWPPMSQPCITRARTIAWTWALVRLLVLLLLLVTYILSK